MKRDMELVRLLLLEVEGEEKPDLSKYAEEVQVYHMALLIEAELIDGSVVSGSNGYPAATHAIRLTWKGHEFLDAARNETIWKKALAKVKESGASITLSLLQQVLTNLLKQHFQITTEP
jgi:hypothetical protein